MKEPMLGPNVAIVLLFFGLALVEAIWSRNWIRTFLWLSFGVLFLRADMKAKG